METRMALLEDMLKGNALTGVAVGAAALFLGPTVLPTIGRALRPVAKTVIKGGIMLYRETVAGIGELTTDLVAEAKSELEQDNHAGLEGPAGRASAVHRACAGRGVRSHGEPAPQFLHRRGRRADFHRVDFKAG